MSVFTTIAFGMCAYLASDLGYRTATMVFIGNIDNGICSPWIYFPDTHGNRATVNGHEYGVDITNEGATLYFDDKIFKFVKGSI